jgi:hypothetical protein
LLVILFDLLTSIFIRITQQSTGPILGPLFISISNINEGFQPIPKRGVKVAPILTNLFVHLK